MITADGTVACRCLSVCLCAPFGSAGAFLPPFGPIDQLFIELTAAQDLLKHTHRQTGFFRCSVPFCSVPCRAVQANGNFLLIKINCSSFPFFLFFLFFCRNRQSAGRHHWPAALADTRPAADSRHRRGVALSPGRCLHSCPSTAGPPADVSGKSALSADQQGPGDGGH